MLFMRLCAAFQKVERSGDEQQRQRQLDNAPDEQPHYHQRQSHHEQHSSNGLGRALCHPERQPHTFEEEPAKHEQCQNRNHMYSLLCCEYDYTRVFIAQTGEFQKNNGAILLRAAKNGWVTAPWIPFYRCRRRCRRSPASFLPKAATFPP